MRCRLIISPGNGIARFNLQFGGREVESDDSEYPSDDCLTIRARRLGRQIGRLFIARLQRRVGRLSEDSTAGYFGKRHFVHSRRFFVRCLVPFYFYNYFGLELAAASRMPERRRQAQDGSRRDCVFLDPSATSARYRAV